MALALHCDKIVAKIRSEYPKVAQLLTDQDSKYHALSVLKAAKAITGYNMDTRKFEVDHEGKDNLITWEEYGNKIEAHLKDNPEYKMFPKLLAPAVKKLAKYIHTEHYNEYPYWPDVGETNPGHGKYWHDIDVDEFNSHTVDEMWVVWACNGWLYVRDERPDDDTYIAKFKAQPKLQVLFVNKVKLKILEDNTKKYGIQWAKADLKKVYDQKNLKQISWSSASLFD